MAKYFGTNGIRGTIDVLTPELAYKAALAIGIYFKSGRMLLAMDARLTGPLLKKQVIAGLQAAGCAIVDLGMISTPTAEFMVKMLRADGLIVITASHNPPEYNGLKVTDGFGVAISKERGEEIEKLIEKPPRMDLNHAGGSLHTYNGAVKAHISAILSQIDRNKTLGKRILLDCANGMAATIATYLFRSIGCAVTSINSHIDGSFPGRPSEPSEQNVQDLVRIMKTGSYDCGIAWDGDGDRVILVDEKGEYVIGDKVFALCEILRLREKRGEVATTVATSRIIEDIARRYKSRIVFTKIGAPYLGEEMARNKGAVLGGEEVGGVIWPEISLAKDGFLTAAKIAEALGEKKLSEWLKEIPVYHNKKTKVAADAQQMARIVKSMRDYAAGKKLDFMELDGVRINFKDSWVIVRASGTESCVRVFAEAKTEKKAKALLDEYVRLASGFR